MMVTMQRHELWLLAGALLAFGAVLGAPLGVAVWLSLPDRIERELADLTGRARHGGGA